MSNLESLPYTNNDKSVEMRWFSSFIAVMKRDVLVAYRQLGDVLSPMVFFVVVVSLFPLGIGANEPLLSKVSSGIIWVATLLSSLLSLERLFKMDFIDGSLEQLLLSPVPTTLIVSAKITVHWFLNSLPLILAAPVLGLLMNFPEKAYPALISTFLLGTPVLSCIGAIGAALTVGLRKGGALLSLLILPLYIPVLIFATSAIDAASVGLPYDGQLAILAAMLIGSLTFSPFVVAASLKVSLN